MTEVVLKQTFLVAQPALVAAAPKASLHDELENARALTKSATQHFSALTYGIEKINPSRAQRVGAIRNETLGMFGVGALVAGFFAGCIAGGVSAAHGVSGGGQAAWFFSAFGAGAVLEGALVAVVVAARELGKRQSARRIAPKDVKPFADTFQESTGGTRALADALLAKWLESCHAAKTLSPETLELLESAQARIGTLPSDLRTRANNLREIVETIDAAAPLSDTSVLVLRALIDKFPGEERSELATLVKDIIRASGRPMTYEGEHALHKLAKVYEEAS